MPPNGLSASTPPACQLLPQLSPPQLVSLPCCCRVDHKFCTAYKLQTLNSGVQGVSFCLWCTMVSFTSPHSPVAGVSLECSFLLHCLPRGEMRGKDSPSWPRLTQSRVHGVYFSLREWGGFFCFFFNKFIYLFFGCVGSSLLCTGFL